MNLINEMDIASRRETGEGLSISEITILQKFESELDKARKEVEELRTKIGNSLNEAEKEEGKM